MAGSSLQMSEMPARNPGMKSDLDSSPASAFTLSVLGLSDNATLCTGTLRQRNSVYWDSQTTQLCVLGLSDTATLCTGTLRQRNSVYWDSQTTQLCVLGLSDNATLCAGTLRQRRVHSLTKSEEKLIAALALT
jgi:hypothetical protein